MYQSQFRMDNNGWITDPRVPDPENLPEPLGWTLLVRPYPVKIDQDKSSIILPDDHEESLSAMANIGRVVSIGPCCWTRPEHKDVDGNRFDWLEVGDFVSFPRNSGGKRKFKGVSFVILVDDEVIEKLPDPMVLQDELYKIDIPEEDLKKYNSIY